MIKLGIDLDNTIICYDKLIIRLIKKKFPEIKINKSNNSKQILKKKILKNYGNDEWTKLQGQIYGKKIQSAILFDGFNEVIEQLKESFDIYIISHKTKYPAIGKKINLRNAAKRLLKEKKISYCKNELIKSENIFFAETKKEKIKIIKQQKIDIFIDDLDQILKLLPNKISKIHFSKYKTNYVNFYEWKKISKYLLKKKKIFLEKKIQEITNYKIKIIKKLNLGTNNKLFLVKYNNKKFVLKIFENKRLISFTKELLFLKKTSNIVNTPKIKYFSKKYKFIIMTYIKGAKIKKLSSNDIKEIVNFIRLIQKQKNFYETINKHSLKYATDNIFNVSDIFKNLEKRIKITEKRVQNTKIKKLKLIKMIFLIKKKYKKIKLYLIKNKINFDNSHFMSLSPSDFNINNIIKKNKKLIFIDFEYSGLDNCVKMVLDFISQPSLSLSNIKIIEIINNFNIIFKNLKKNLDSNLIALNNLKWFFIILNSGFQNEFNKIQINESIKYFNERLTK